MVTNDRGTYTIRAILVAPKDDTLGMTCINNSAYLLK